jgi:two-component system response regulator RegA
VTILLVIEDSIALAEDIRAALPQYESAHLAHDLAAARAFLTTTVPDCIVMDICLPDGTSMELLAMIRALSPLPRVIAISGAADPEQTFRLAQAGVRAFIAKPLNLEELQSVWQRVMSEGPDLEPLLRGSVGHVPLGELEARVRKTMAEEALARSKGSVSGAARLLRIPRSVFQYVRKSVLRG